MQKIDKILSKLRERKNKIIFLILPTLLVIFLLSVFVESSFELNMNIEDFTVYTEDSIRLEGSIYYPNNLDSESNYPTLIYCHSLTGNRHENAILRYNLLEHGFIVVTFDLRGHGSSLGGLEVDRSYMLEGYANSPKHSLDIDAVLDFILTKELVDNESIGLFGYSLGGSAVSIYSYFDSLNENPRIKASVSISFLGDYHRYLGVNETNPKNFLAIIGAHDEFFPTDMIKLSLNLLTGNDNAEFRTLYGNFSNGTAREVYIVPDAGHTNFAYRSITINETIKWFEQVFYGEISNIPIFQRDFIYSISENLRTFSAYGLQILIIYFLGYAFFLKQKKIKRTKEYKSLKILIENKNPLYLYFIFTFLASLIAIGMQYFIPVPKLGAPIFISIFISSMMLIVLALLWRGENLNIISIIKGIKQSVEKDFLNYMLIIILSSIGLITFEIMNIFWIENRYRTIYEIFPTIIYTIVIFFSNLFNQIYLFRGYGGKRKKNIDFNYKGSFMNMFLAHIFQCLLLIFYMAVRLVHYLNTFLLIPYLTMNILAILLMVIIFHRTRSIFLSSLIPAIYMGWFLSVSMPFLAIF